jgi:hypothetical protein
MTLPEELFRTKTSCGWDGVGENRKLGSLGHLRGSSSARDVYRGVGSLHLILPFHTARAPASIRYSISVLGLDSRL